MAKADEAQVSIAEENGNVTVTGGGSLTYISDTQFGKSLKEASLNAESVTVDLRQAAFIDTQIVQDLGKAAVTLLNRGKRLRVLVSETAYPLRVLTISGYNALMDIEPC